MATDQLVYEISISDSSNTGGNSFTIGDNYYWPYMNPSNYYTYTSWPATIYMYQITCPKDRTVNWMQLDTITVCTGKRCGAKLKAVTQQADYEIYEIPVVGV